MKKFTITESEKKHILELYGIINESEESEISGFYFDYISNTSCGDMAVDLEKFQKQPEYQNLSEDDKETLKNAIMGLKNPGAGVGILRSKGYTIKGDCGILKPYKNNCECLKSFMVEQLNQNFEKEKESLKVRACVLSRIKNLNLNFCSKNQEVPQTEKTQQTTSCTQWEDKTFVQGDGITKPKITVTKTPSLIQGIYEGPDKGGCIQRSKYNDEDTPHQLAGITVYYEASPYLKELYKQGVYVKPDMVNITMERQVNKYFKISIPLIKTTEDKAVTGINERGGMDHGGDLTEINNIENDSKYILKEKVTKKAEDITETFICFRNINDFPLKTSSNNSNQNTSNTPQTSQQTIYTAPVSQGTETPPAQPTNSPAQPTNSPAQPTNSPAQPTTAPPTNTYTYKYPGDKNYRYKVDSKGNWWAKNLKNNKEFNLTGSNYQYKFQPSIDNLDRQFKNARKSDAPRKSVK